jgi:rhamnosyltransferase
MSGVLSVVIPVKNGGSDLERCLDAILMQKLDDEVEIVVVDSGSTDGSVAAARTRGARVFEIPPDTFTHGGSRNLGATNARGDILVFISQDAYPTEPDWLTLLTAPLRQDSAVAGVYGRQLAHHDASPPEIYFLDFLYGPNARRQQAAGVATVSMDSTLFSNVNAAIRRELWERFPFATDIVMSEDQVWSREAVLAGYTLVYEPRAAVRHSHNYTMLAAFRRFFDSGVSSERAYMADNSESGNVLRRRALAYGWGEIRWLWQTHQRGWIPYAIVYEASKMAGLLLGINHRRLPLALKRRFSALPATFAAD